MCCITHNARPKLAIPVNNQANVHRIKSNSTEGPNNEKEYACTASCLDVNSRDMKELKERGQVNHDGSTHLINPKNQFPRPIIAKLGNRKAAGLDAIISF